MNPAASVSICLSVHLARNVSLSLFLSPGTSVDRTPALIYLSVYIHLSLSAAVSRPICISMYFHSLCVYILPMC